MPDPLNPSTAARIDDLKRRWSAAPSSRLFLQLAEEYRKAGKFAEGIEVLRNGLRTNPNYLSAQIALARTLYEAGILDEAQALFLKVLKSDPENLIANRLLGDIYLKQGDRVAAIKRYKLVRVLHSGDDELQDLVTELDAELAAERVPAPDDAAIVAAPSEILAEDSDAPGGTSSVATSSVTGVAVKEDHEDPIGEIRSHAVVVAESVPPPPVETPAAPQPTPAFAETRRTGEPEEETEDLFETAGSAPAPRSSREDDLFESSGLRIAVPVASDLEARLEPRPSTPSATSEAEVNENFDEDPFGVSAPATPPAQPAAMPAARESLTLANMYLQQGHHTEAGEIAERLLASDPDNDAARQLVEAARRIGPASEPDRREQLLADLAGGGGVRAGGDRRELKIGALKNWLSSIKPEVRG